MTNTCPACHSDNPDAQKFCGECGTRLRPAKDVPVAYTETLQSPVQELTRGAVIAGRYEIIEELGRGGMGKVYRVEDKKIRGEIALKLIKPEISADPQTIERFRNELKTTRMISHRNICRMFDLGEDRGSYFITMEFVPGQDLKGLIGQTGRLTIGKSISIARQVCEGLAEAHRLGVVHRDLKPSNIIIDKEGNARILDFGIAKSVHAQGLTGDGVMIGTPEYMSPEQVEGTDVDRRSDLYSLGVILYEMVTGRLPFSGETPVGIAMKHLREVPEDPAAFNPQVPQALSRLVLTCLEKKREKRYQSAEALLAELRQIEGTKPDTVAISRGKTSIAVLPFRNMSGDPEQEYFCEGLAEELINALTQIKGLWVVARTSAFSFKDEKIDIREIGRKLNVDHVLEGSVRKAGTRLRITAQLVNVADGYHAWSERYDRDMADVFAIQDEICLAIVDKLRVKLHESEKEIIAKRPTEDQDAYDVYLKGRFYLESRMSEMSKAIECFEKAIARDPNYALAYVGLADTYDMLQAYSFLAPGDAFPKAKALAAQALAIDPRLGEAHATLGWIGFCYERDWEEGERHFREAIRLNPNYGTAHSWFGLLLLGLGKFEEAKKELQEGLARDPLSLIINSSSGWGYYLSRQYEKAVEQLKKTLVLDANTPRAHFWLGQTLEQLGDLEGAIESFKRAVEVSHGNTQYLASLGHGYALAGERGKAEEILAKMDEMSRSHYVSPYDRALIHAGLGDKDRALEWLENAYAIRDTWVIFSRVDPRFDAVRSDPRFAALLEK